MTFFRERDAISNLMMPHTCKKRFAFVRGSCISLPQLWAPLPPRTSALRPVCVARHRRLSGRHIMEVQHAWELSKENVLPRKRGRDANELTRVFGATIGECGIGDSRAIEARVKYLRPRKPRSNPSYTAAHTPSHSFHRHSANPRTKGKRRRSSARSLASATTRWNRGCGALLRGARRLWLRMLHHGRHSEKTT